MESLPLQSRNANKSSCADQCGKLLRSLPLRNAQFLGDKSKEQIPLAFDALDALNHHVANIKQPSDLLCYQMHCECRMTYEDDKCVLTTASASYAEALRALAVCYTLMFDIDPESGPPPATKKERAT